MIERVADYAIAVAMFALALILGLALVALMAMLFRA